MTTPDNGYAKSVSTFYTNLPKTDSLGLGTSDSQKYKDASYELKRAKTAKGLASRKMAGSEVGSKKMGIALSGVMLAQLDRKKNDGTDTFKNYRNAQEMVTEHFSGAGELEAKKGQLERAFILEASTFLKLGSVSSVQEVRNVIGERLLSSGVDAGKIKAAGAKMQMEAGKEDILSDFEGLSDEEMMLTKLIYSPRVEGAVGIESCSLSTLDSFSSFTDGKKEFDKEKVKEERAKNTVEEIDNMGDFYKLKDSSNFKENQPNKAVITSEKYEALPDKDKELYNATSISQIAAESKDYEKVNDLGEDTKDMGMAAKKEKGPSVIGSFIKDAISGIYEGAGAKKDMFIREHYKSFSSWGIGAVVVTGVAVASPSLFVGAIGILVANEAYKLMVKYNKYAKEKLETKVARKMVLQNEKDYVFRQMLGETSKLLDREIIGRPEEDMLNLLNAVQKEEILDVDAMDATTSESNKAESKAKKSLEKRISVIANMDERGLKSLDDEQIKAIVSDMSAVDFGKDEEKKVQRELYVKQVAVAVSEPRQKVLFEKELKVVKNSKVANGRLNKLLGEIGAITGEKLEAKSELMATDLTFEDVENVRFDRLFTMTEEELELAFISAQSSSQKVDINHMKGIMAFLDSMERGDVEKTKEKVWNAWAFGVLKSEDKSAGMRDITKHVKETKALMATMPGVSPEESDRIALEGLRLTVSNQNADVGIQQAHFDKNALVEFIGVDFEKFETLCSGLKKKHKESIVFLEEIKGAMAADPINGLSSIPMIEEKSKTMLNDLKASNLIKAQQGKVYVLDDFEKEKKSATPKAPTV